MHNNGLRMAVVLHDHSSAREPSCNNAALHRIAVAAR